jgi:hypothetical protein
MEKDHKKKRGDIYAMKIDEIDEYIYFYFITGNNRFGDLVVPYNYGTKEIEKDIDKILSQETLYEKPAVLIDNVMPYNDGLVFIGNKKPSWDDWREPIHFRSSIKCNTSEEDNQYDYYYCDKYPNIVKYPQYIDKAGQYRQRDVERGIVYYYDDWAVETCFITGNRGKLEMRHFIEIGKLPEDMKKSMVHRTIPNYNDFKSKYLQGFDRNSALYNLYQ